MNNFSSLLLHTRRISPVVTSTPAIRYSGIGSSAQPSFYEKLNLRWHERTLQIFIVIVLGHWAEHFFQAYQIYVMKRPRPKALGMLGLVYPWLVKTETLHYAYALIMLIGIWVLRKGFTGIPVNGGPSP